MEPEPSGCEIEQCTSVLRRLRPVDLQRPELSGLVDAATALFTRHIVKAQFSSDDVVSFLKEQSQHRQRLKELRRLHSLIMADHEKRLEAAETCGLNEARKKRLAEIRLECSVPALPLLPSSAAEEACLPTPAAAVGASIVATGATSVRARIFSGAAAMVPAAATVPVAPAAPAAATPAAAQAAAVAASDARGNGISEDAVGEGGQTSELPPRGNFRNCCNVCRGFYYESHDFYHQLCHRCAELNLEKRRQTADLNGYVCVVTGGRVRIGYHIVLKLLRAGAFVFTTTRFPHDAAQRYSREPDFARWHDRLEVCGPVELSNVRLVEELCRLLTARFPRIHVLVNNAAQTLTRPPGWFERMLNLETTAAAHLPPSARALLSSPLQLTAAAAAAAATATAAPPGAPAPPPQIPLLDCGAAAVDVPPTVAPPAASVAQQVEMADRVVGREEEAPEEEAPEEALEETALAVAAPDAAASAVAAAVTAAGALSHGCRPAGEFCVSAGELADFPEGALDESRQPLDLSGVNSWSRRLGEVSTLEMLQTLAANAAAPFILCSKLVDALSPRSDGEPFGHVVNVSALEGKFSVGKKCTGHPHTNMGKAALNMLTYTSAASFFQRRVLMNCVDTGWVTDMAPGGVGVVASRHATHVAPPLDEEDGAARVLDPIFSHVLDPTWLVRGQFFRNYYIAGW